MQYMRKVILAPFTRESKMPRFAVYLIDWHGGLSRATVSYRLDQLNANGTKETIAEGNDYSPAPCHSVDGDEAIEGLMGFLTLQRGDTDSESFERIISTERHRQFSQEYAEQVSSEVARRFTCSECRDATKLRTAKRDGYPVKVCSAH